MRKALLALAAAAAIIFSVVAPTAASATSAPALACNIQPNTSSAFTTGTCTTHVAASSYDVAFQVQGGSGTYTYTWTHPSGYTVYGCTTTSDYCTLGGVSAAGRDVHITVGVVLHQGTSSTALTETAHLLAVCGGSYFC